MKILAFEFSSPQRSVAVADAGRRLSEIIETRGRGTSALSMVEEALQEARLEREQIECLVIGLGPGSYSGIRTAIAVAQGWQLARGVKLLGISSVECLAAQARSDGLTDRLNIVIDAQRNELYIAGYDIAANECRETSPLKLASVNDAQTLAKSGEILIGPEVTRWYPGGMTLFPRAAKLAELAVTRNDFWSGEKLEPIYLRETGFVKAPPPRFPKGNVPSLP